MAELVGQDYLADKRIQGSLHQDVALVVRSDTEDPGLSADLSGEADDDIAISPVDRAVKIVTKARERPFRVVRVPAADLFNAQQETKVFFEEPGGRGDGLFDLQEGLPWQPSEFFVDNDLEPDGPLGSRLPVGHEGTEGAEEEQKE